MPYGREKEYKKSSPTGKLGPKPMKGYNIGGGAGSHKGGMSYGPSEGHGGKKGNLKKKAKMKYGAGGGKY